MNCTIVKAATEGDIKAIPSKSAAHRWLIAAALSGLSIDEAGSGVSKDIEATRSCLKELLRAYEARDLAELEPNESGSTLRFLVPIAAALGVDANFNCKGRLALRPMEIMRNLLETHGASMSEEGSNPIRIRGKLESGEYRLRGDVSSQYVTGLIMALPLLEGDSIIEIEGQLQSRPYVDMTLEVVRSAGIEIKEDDNRFIVRGSQEYRLEVLPEIEGDWSNAAFYLVLDAINEFKGLETSINVTGLKADSAQGDRAIKKIIEDAKRPGELVVDASDIPDLVPIVSVLASARPAGLVTRIINAERLKYKESNRLESVANVINALGGDIEILEDGLKITAVSELEGGTVNSYNDHRIVMMAAVARACSKNDITIEGAEAVDKSYGDFFADYVKLCGEIRMD